MASKAKNVYVCSECGYESAKWFGCCPGCNEWNTMSEVFKAPENTKKVTRSVSALTSSVQKINEILQDFFLFSLYYISRSKKSKGFY